MGKPQCRHSARLKFLQIVVRPNQQELVELDRDGCLAERRKDWKGEFRARSNNVRKYTFLLSKRAVSPSYKQIVIVSTDGSIGGFGRVKLMVTKYGQHGQIHTTKTHSFTGCTIRSAVWYVVALH